VSKIKNIISILLVSIIVIGCSNRVKKKTPDLNELTYLDWDKDGDNWIGKWYYKGEEFNGIGYSYVGEYLDKEIQYFSGKMKSYKLYYRGDGGVKSYESYRYDCPSYTSTFPPSRCKTLHIEYYHINEFKRKFGEEGEKRLKEINRYNKNPSSKEEYLCKYLIKSRFRWEEDGSRSSKEYFFVGGGIKKLIEYNDREVVRRYDYFDDGEINSGGKCEKIVEHHYSLDGETYINTRIQTYNEDGSSDVVFEKNGELLSKHKYDKDGDKIEDGSKWIK